MPNTNPTSKETPKAIAIDDIESNGGEHEVLEADEIDALCERINTSNLLIEG